MSASSKLKWKRSLSKLRYVHDELDFVLELSKASAGAFQEYYENFCAKRQIDISELNKKNRDRVKKAYANVENSKEKHEPGNIQHTGSCDIEVYRELEQPSNDSEYTQNTDTNEVHAAFSKLFKKIAVMLHPDKIDRSLPDEVVQDMIDAFTLANSALVKKKYFVLLDIAEKYNISTPKNYSQQVRWMKQEILKIEHDIDNKKMTYNFLFGETETDEQRDDVIRKFMLQLFGVNID